MSYQTEHVIERLRMLIKRSTHLMVNVENGDGQQCDTAIIRYDQLIHSWFNIYMINIWCVKQL
jgi:hypothetical protein